jgi:hypothetical protein
VFAGKVVGSGSSVSPETRAPVVGAAAYTVRELTRCLLVSVAFDRPSSSFFGTNVVEHEFSLDARGRSGAVTRGC